MSERQIRERIESKKEKINQLKEEIEELREQLPTKVETRGDPVVRMH